MYTQTRVLEAISPREEVFNCTCIQVQPTESEGVFAFGVQELGRYKATMKLPFNAFGTMAMAREVRFVESTLRQTVNDLACLL